MIPGLVTKLSEEVLSLTTSINPKRDVVHVTNTATTTVLATIAPTFGGGFSGLLFLVNRSGADITTVTTGNIIAAVTIPVNMAVGFVYSKTTGKWYPGAIS